MLCTSVFPSTHFMALLSCHHPTPQHHSVKIRISQNMFILIAEWKRRVIQPRCSKFYWKLSKLTENTLWSSILISLLRNIIIIRGIINPSTQWDRVRSTPAGGPPLIIRFDVEMLDTLCHHDNFPTPVHVSLYSLIWSIFLILAVHISSKAHQN